MHDYVIGTLNRGEYGVRAESAKAEHRNLGGLKPGYTLCFKSRRDLLEYPPAIKVRSGSPPR